LQVGTGISPRAHGSLLQAHVSARAQQWVAVHEWSANDDSRSPQRHPSPLALAAQPSVVQEQRSAGPGQADDAQQRVSANAAREQTVSFDSAETLHVHDCPAPNKGMSHLVLLLVDPSAHSPRH